MKKIYLLGLASIVALGIQAQTTIKVKNPLKGKMKYENATSKQGNGNNAVQQVAGSISCDNQYTAGTSMTLNFTLTLTNTDEEYVDSLSLTFPAGMTPTAAPNPFPGPQGGGQAAEALNGINGQTISWGDNDNSYGGIQTPTPTGGAVTYNFSIDVTIDANLTGNQTAIFHMSGDGFGASPGGLDGTITIYPAGAQLVDLFVMGVRPLNNINLDRGCGLGLDTVLTLVKNIGTTTESNIAVNLSINGTPAGSTVIPGPLAPGDSTFAFFLPANDFSGTGAKTLKAWVAQANDIALANDTVTEGFFNAVPTALTSATYTNGIEAGNDVNSLSIFGSAAPYTGISGIKRSGQQALFTTVNATNGGVVGNTYTYQLVLPCMDVIQGETYRIVYYRRTNGSAATANGQTAVYTGTESSEAGMTTELKPYSAITTYGTWLKDSVEYTATASETRYFSISGRGTVISSTNQMNVRLDDISIFKIACPTIFNTITSTICAGDTLTVGNSNYTTSGTYTNLFTSINGCDSVVFTNLTVNSLPNVTINGIDTICNGESTDLTATGASTYLWNNGFASDVYSVNPTNLTSYTVTGTDANGCKSSDSILVFVNSLPTLITAPLINLANCGSADGSINGIVVSGNGTLTYLWENASNDSVGSAIDLTNVFAGVYNLFVTDSNSCTASFGPYSISNPGAPAAPTVTLNDSSVCVGSSVALSANTIGTDIVYTWSGPAGFSSSNANDTIAAVSLSSNGIFSATATDTLSGCVSASSIVTLTVNALPVVSLTSSSSSACEGSSSITLNSFSSSTNGTGVYTGSSSITGDQFSPVTVGTYTITYNYTDANGCSSAATTTIVVNAIVTPAFTQVAAICSGATLAALPISSTNSVTGTWSPALNNTATATYTFTPTTGQCASNANMTITVNQLPSVSVSAANDSACVNQNTLALIGVPTGGTFSGSGVTGSNFDASVAGLGTKTVTYAYTDNNGCSNTSTTSIIVDACVGINELNVNTVYVNVYPNPSHGVFTVNISENEASMEVYSIIGENVYSSKVVKGNNTIDLSNLAAGSYIVKLNNGGKSTAKRIVINK